MSIARAVDRYRQNLAEQRQNPDLRPVLPTPFPGLNRKLGGGLRAGEIAVVGARTSVGKTSFVLEWVRGVCEHLLRTGDPRVVGMISAEMSEEALVQRFTCASLELPSWRVPTLAGDEAARFEAELDRIRAWPLAIYDKPSPELGAIKQEVFRMGGGWRDTLDTPSPFALLVLDHLGKVRVQDQQGRPIDSEYVRLSTTADALYEMARYYRCPLIEVAQINRGVESRIGRDRQGETDVELTRPLPSDIQGSGIIEQNADAILLLWRRERYLAMLEGREEQRGPLEINVAKNRNGSTGLVYADFVPSYAKLVVPKEQGPYDLEAAA